MNFIITRAGSRILMNHVSVLMLVKLPQVQWNPESYAMSWLRHHRSANDIRTRVASNPRNISRLTLCVKLLSAGIW